MTQYVANHASRIIIKAVGDLDTESIGLIRTESDSYADLAELEDEYHEKVTLAPESAEPEGDFDILSYKPSISSEGVWSLSETDLGTSIFHAGVGVS